MPNCTKYPEPCPNQCEIGTVPRCDMEKHLTQCPLQLVECEFAQAGCQERVPRRDLARHVEEEGQRHLLSMSLLNLGLTRELHQKMAEKDQQIAELQEQNSKLEKQIKDLQEQTKAQLQTQLEAGFSGLHGEIQTQDGKLTDLQREIPKQITGVQKYLEQKLTNQQKETEKQISGLQALLQNGNETLRKTLQQQAQEQSKQIHDSLILITDFGPPFEITLTNFSVYKARGGGSAWFSDHFHSHTGGYEFLLIIETDGYQEAKGTHISAFFYPIGGKVLSQLQTVQITAHLQLLNQRGDHGHVTATLNRTGVVKGSGRIGIAQKLIAHSELGYSAAKNTQYVKDDCLHFRLYVKVDRQK